MKSSLAQLVAAIAVCTAVLIGYGFWYATVSAKSAAVAILQNQIDTRTETVKRMVSTRAALAEISGDEAVVQSYFVPETGVVAFIDGLESRGRALGATVTVLSVSTVKSSAQPALELALSIAGTFDAVMRTVGAIEYAPYDITVSMLSATERGDTKSTWHADLKLLVGSVPAGAVTLTP